MFVFVLFQFVTFYFSSYSSKLLWVFSVQKNVITLLCSLTLCKSMIVFVFLVLVCCFVFLMVSSMN